ncbi:MAG: prephenate dehydratase [Betaproteobacteria bacterium]|nr:prephenate dehydratase [Betaproteobacteria bacterium]
MDEPKQETLTDLRAQIDAVDDQILALLNARGRLAQAVGHSKGKAPVYRPEREAQVLRRLTEQNSGPLTGASISILFREIMSACRSLEQPLSVAYLGPQGTFSEQAAIKQFGQSASRLPQASIDEVFRAVERGEAHYGVVPIENSTEGVISRTLDLLLDADLVICGEVFVRVRQNLMRRSADGVLEDGLDGIRVVYSHAQSLAQCQNWLRQNLPGAEQISVASNSEAARLAAERDDAAAIGGELAAAYHGLNLVARDIEDTAKNTTRFVVLAREAAAPSGRDRTSLAVAINNRPGALVELLAPFARHGINLISWNTRPARNELWEYVFCVDAEGHASDPALKAALAELEKNTGFLKVLGAYPVAVS